MPEFTRIEIFGGAAYYPHPLPFDYAFDAFDVRDATWLIDAQYAGLGVVEIGPGFIQDTVRALGLARLAGVLQIPYLTALRVNSRPIGELPEGPVTFDLDRLRHSILGAVFDMLILIRAMRSESEIKLGIIAALSHDVLTPAGGDAMKSIAPKQLDEDSHYHELFERLGPTWKAFVQKHNLPRDSREILIAAIKGEGLLGRLHDITDTLSYLTLDASALVQKYYAMPDHLKKLYDPNYRRIRELLKMGVLTFWRTVEIDNDYPVASDWVLLRYFVELRMEMLNEVYLHPATGAIRYFMTEVAYRYYGTREKPTRQQLVTMTDRQLHRAIGRAIGIKNPETSLALFGKPPTRHSFRNWRLAHEFVAKRDKTGAFYVMADSRDWPPVGSKTDKYFVYDISTHQPDQLNIVYREYVKYIELQCGKISQLPVQVYLYQAPKRGLSPGLLKAWNEAKGRWRIKEG